MPEEVKRWSTPPATVITGATGWLGSALIEHLLASERKGLRALLRDGEAVSYTHLTLPTICSV